MIDPGEVFVVIPRDEEGADTVAMRFKNILSFDTNDENGRSIVKYRAGSGTTTLYSMVPVEELVESIHDQVAKRSR